jgi:hypothetical protein
MSINYRQVPNFLKQREQGIPGIPFLSMIQFAVALGVGGAGYMIGFSIIFLILLVIVAFVLTIIWQGEYIYRRLFTIGLSLVRKGVGQNAIVELKDWQEEEDGVQLEDHERATIHMEGSILAGQG